MSLTKLTSVLSSYVFDTALGKKVSEIIQDFLYRIGVLEDNRVFVLDGVVTILVGTGGHPSINSALEFASRKYRKAYEQATTTPSPGYADDTNSIVILLKSGFVMMEQVLLRGTDLGWITIKSEDATVTINRASLTKIAYFPGTASEMYPVFYAGDGSVMPTIACKFSMDATGVATNRHFYVCNRGSRGHLWPFSGCLNAGGHGVYARESSEVSARLAVCDGAGDTAFIAANNGRLNLQGASGKNSSIGCTSTDGSTVNFAGGIADHCTNYGVNCLEGSSLNCSSANLTFAGQYGIRASNCDKVSAYLADTSDSVVAGVWAEQASTVAIKQGKADRCGTGIRADGTSKVDFESGSAINCTSRACHALSCSDINALNATLTGAVTNGVLANINARINVNGANCRKGVSDSSSDIAVGNGSIISAAGSTGGTSKTINVLDRDGVITK